MSTLPIVLAAAAALASQPAPASGPAAPPPTLEYVFTAEVTVAPAVEQGQVDGARKRFIAITGGTIRGPRLHGEIMPGGGDWQTIGANGLTTVEARYFLKADDGTIIEVINPGVRVGTPAVIDRLARGERVDPSEYYFRTTPSFKVAEGPHRWLQRSAFVARGIRLPDRVLIDVYQIR